MTAAWVDYAMARANWISLHIVAGSPETRSYTRSFDEEVTGRESLVTIWAELKAHDATLRDGYLDELQAVKEAGLNREYVWTSLRPTAWGQQANDLQLDRYAEWAKVNLGGHIVETHADA